MTSLKKVFFLINSLEIGGGERVMLQLARLIRKHAIVKLITLKNVVEYELDVEHEALSKVKNGNSMICMYPVYVSRLRALLIKEKPDVLLSFLEFSNMININAANGTDTKTVISVRATPSEVYTKGMYGAFFRRVIRKSYPKADLLIANSKITKHDLEDNFGIFKDKIKVIYNPVDVKEIREKSLEKIDTKHKQLFEKGQIIVNMGRLTHQKGQFNLIKAFSLVKKDVPEAKLVILGEGHLRKRLEQLTTELGLEKSVFLLGNQKNPFKIFSRSDLFVFSSFFEGFPNALTEAMACGLPVISTDCKSGPREILAPKTNIFNYASKADFAEYGVLTPMTGQEYTKAISSQEKILADCIIRLLKDRKVHEKYSRLSLKRANDFNCKTIAGNFLKELESVKKND